MSMSQLKNTYAREGIVLVLGAGVSVGSGIPTWMSLIRGMVTKSFGGDESMFDRLREQGLSLTTIASLLEERSASRKAFVEDVRRRCMRTSRSTVWEPANAIVGSSSGISTRGSGKM